MAEKEQQEIVIIRRRAGEEESHHGGAWKIAFADFMTAMMALFLVLWLISSTSDKTKKSVAQYFNPVKLVDMTTLKKGFHDPKPTEMGAGTSTREAPPDEESSQTLVIAKEVGGQTGARLPTHSESALFRDPYAVLAEIVATARTDSATGQARAAQTAEEAQSEAVETFKDPFSTVPQTSTPKSQTALAASQSIGSRPPVPMENHSLPEARGAPDAGGEPRAAEPAIKTGARAAGAQRESIAESPLANEGEAAKLKSDIVNAVKPEARAQNAPRIEVQSTDEGILVSLTDDVKYMMFAIGSAEPQPKTIEVMAKIGRLLKARAGSIVIRGHTDGRPYKSATYDNWRLSTARAHMAHYMLARGGLDEKRIEKIEGLADRRLKFSNDPTAPGNRRIEILLRKDKP